MGIDEIIDLFNAAKEFKEEHEEEIQALKDDIADETETDNNVLDGSIAKTLNVTDDKITIVIDSGAQSFIDMTTTFDRDTNIFKVSTDRGSQGFRLPPDIAIEQLEQHGKNGIIEFTIPRDN